MNGIEDEEECREEECKNDGRQVFFKGHDYYIEIIRMMGLKKSRQKKKNRYKEV